MLKYILSRLLKGLFSILLISIVVFLLASLKGTPEKCLQEAIEAQSITEQFFPVDIKCIEKYKKNLPVFYCSIKSLADPDTLHKVYDNHQKRILKQRLALNGDWTIVQNYSQQLQQSLNTLNHAQWDSSLHISKQQFEQAQITARSKFNSITQTASIDDTQTLLHTLDELYAPLPPSLHTDLTKLNTAFQALSQPKSQWKRFVPALQWHGTNNQYHHWITSLVTKGDFGYSYKNRKVSKVVFNSLAVSLRFSILSILLAYLISIPLGIYTAMYKGQWVDRISGILLFGLRAIPSFLVATLLILLFANPDIFNWFAPSFDDQTYTFRYMALPLIAYTYGSFTLLSRSMRLSMLENMQQDYIRTAKAKGLSKQRIAFKHVFRNALLPILALFAYTFPSLVGGSVIIETIFGIPGMGRLLFLEALDGDLPIIMAIVMLTSIMTILGFLIADILSKLADPRIQLS